MGSSQFSRRNFLGTTALGTGFLALMAADLKGQESPSLAPTVTKVWQTGRDYTLEFAKAMPDADFAFKPTPEVFSFAEQLLHLAGTNYWFFSAIKGEKSPKPQDTFAAEGKKKEEVVKILVESFKYGDEVINGFTEKSAAELVILGSNKLAKWKLILFCVDHIVHHRGQMVTYLRLKGIKPPQYRAGFFG